MIKRTLKIFELQTILMVIVYCSIACTHMNSATILNRINDHYNALIDIQSGDKQEFTANDIKTIKDLFIYYRDYFADVETHLSKNDSRHCVEQLRSITNNNFIFDDQYASKAANQLKEMYEKQLKLNGQYDFGFLGIEMSNLADSAQVINIKYADCRAYSIETVENDSYGPENAIGKITLFDTKISKEWLSSHSIDQIVEIGNDNAKICCCIQCLDTSSIEIYVLSETSALGIEKDLTTVGLPIGIISIPLVSKTA